MAAVNSEFLQTLPSTSKPQVVRVRDLIWFVGFSYSAHKQFITCRRFPFQFNGKLPIRGKYQEFIRIVQFTQFTNSVSISKWKESVLCSFGPHLQKLLSVEQY